MTEKRPLFATGEAAARLDKKTLEEGTVFAPKFDANGLIPVITVEAGSGAILMHAYMNEAALQATLETGTAHYWSRSRGELWLKGETSGQVQTVQELRTDCDQDTLLLTVTVGGDGGCCHVGYRSCFYRRVETGPEAARLVADAEKLTDV